MVFPTFLRKPLKSDPPLGISTSPRSLGELTPAPSDGLTRSRRRSKRLRRSRARSRVEASAASREGRVASHRRGGLRRCLDRVSQQTLGLLSGQPVVDLRRVRNAGSARGNRLPWHRYEIAPTTLSALRPLSGHERSGDEPQNPHAPGRIRTCGLWLRRPSLRLRRSSLIVRDAFSYCGFAALDENWLRMVERRRFEAFRRGVGAELAP
jgi:hypothetical protein